MYIIFLIRIRPVSKKNGATFALIYAQLLRRNFVYFREPLDSSGQGSGGWVNDLYVANYHSSGAFLVCPQYLQFGHPIPLCYYRASPVVGQKGFTYEPMAYRDRFLPSGGNPHYCVPTTVSGQNSSAAWPQFAVKGGSSYENNGS